jgi:hypothetical protein
VPTPASCIDISCAEWAVWSVSQSAAAPEDQSHPVFVVAAETDVFCPPDVVKPAFETISGLKRLTIVPDTTTRSAPTSSTRPPPWPPTGSPGTCDRRARLPGQPERRVLVGDESERIGGHPAGPAEDSLHEAEHAPG